MASDIVDGVTRPGPEILSSRGTDKFMKSNLLDVLHVVFSFMVARMFLAL